MSPTISTPIRSLDSTLLPLPASAIWPVLADIGNYPQWWPKSQGIKVLRASPELIGNKIALRPFQTKSFTCRVISCEDQKRITLEYGGVITGTGEWRLEPVGQGTRVSFALDGAVRGWPVALLSRFFDLAVLHKRSMRVLFRHLHRRLFSC